MDIIDNYCRRISNTLQEFKLTIPLGGVVSENFYTYPLPPNHLKEFCIKPTRSPLFDFEITVYRSMKRALVRKKYPVAFDEKIFCEIDQISAEAIKNLANNESAIGIIKEGENYLMLSVIRIEQLNDFKIRDLTGEITQRVENRIKKEESLRMYV